MEARDKFDKAADLMGAESRTKKTIWGQFWSAHQVSQLLSDVTAGSLAYFGRIVEHFIVRTQGY